MAMTRIDVIKKQVEGLQAQAKHLQRQISSLKSSVLQIEEALIDQIQSLTERVVVIEGVLEDEVIEPDPEEGPPTPSDQYDIEVLGEEFNG